MDKNLAQDQKQLRTASVQRKASCQDSHCFRFYLKISLCVNFPWKVPQPLPPGADWPVASLVGIPGLLCGHHGNHGIQLLCFSAV